MKNRLNYWRHELRFDTKKQMAKFLGINYSQYAKWESHINEPTAESYFDIWLKIKEKFPYINMQDLIDPE